MTNFTIKQVDLSDDLEAICLQMQAGLWGKDNDMSNYTPEFLKNYLESGGVLLLAYKEETIAGSALCYVLPHPGGEHSLYVHELDTHPNYRRQGVASKLMNGVKMVAKEGGYVEYWLATESDNDPANALYKSLNPYEIEPSITYSYKVD